MAELEELDETFLSDGKGMWQPFWIVSPQELWPSESSCRELDSVLILRPFMAGLLDFFFGSELFPISA